MLKSSGRGSLFIQSTPVTRTDLHDFSSLLFDLHGQHEHQSLLDLENHRKLVDRWAGTEELAERFHLLYASLASLRERLSTLVSDERERLRRIDLLTYAVTEIKALAPKPGEEEELEKELAILVHHEKLFTLLEEVHGAVAESGGGVLAALRKARHSMEEILAIDPSLSRQSHQLEDAFYEIEDFAESVRQYKSRTDFSPGRLDDVQGRLSAIRGLEKKYGDTVEKVLEYCRAGEQELSGMENWEEQKKSLRGGDRADGKGDRRRCPRAVGEEKDREPGSAEEDRSRAAGSWACPRSASGCSSRTRPGRGRRFSPPGGRTQSSSSSPPTSGSRSRSCAPSPPAASFPA